MTTPLTRRHFMTGTAAAMAVGLLPSSASANVPVPYDWDASPPVDQRADYIAWMTKNRGEDPGFLGKRWDRFKQLHRRQGHLGQARHSRLPADAARAIRHRGQSRQRL